MSFSGNIIEPAELSRPDTLGLYAMPIFADMANTGDRLKATADRVGFPIIASDLFMQKKRMIFDMKARTANQPSGDVYRDMSKRRAEFFQKLTDKHGLGAAVRVGIGDSLGVPAVQGMQIHGEGKTFDAVLLRDGWNLSKPSGVAAGIARYAKYQVRDALNSRKNPHDFDIPESAYSKVEPEENETNPLQKLLNVADLMRGDEGRKNALSLAAMSGLAVNVVCLRDGLSGTEFEQTMFVSELETVRNFADAAAGNTATFNLRADIVDGWHSDLLDPARGAQDIEDTLALLG